MILDKETFIATAMKYRDIVDNMYIFNCLITSGFNEEQAYMLKSTLKDLWLKDENCRCISGLSDMLYEYCKNHDEDVREIPTRKLLVELYKESE